MTSFTWAVADMIRALPDECVSIVNLTLTAVRVENEEEVASACRRNIKVSLEAGDPEAADFIPFDALTEEQVIEWSLEALDGSIEGYEAYCDHLLDEQISPSTSRGLPW